MRRAFGTLLLTGLACQTGGGPTGPPVAAPLDRSADPIRVAAEVRLPARRPEEFPGLHNVFRLSPRILTGSEPHGEEGLDALARLGVKTVISVDGKAPDAEGAARRGMRYVHVPLQYSGVKPGEILRLAKTFRELPGPFYTHCFHGKHRGPPAAEIGRLLLDGVPREQALAEMKQWCGTAEKYGGLYRDVATAALPTAEETAAFAWNFPPRQTFAGLRQLMLPIPRAFDNLEALEKRGFEPDPGHPDVVAAEEANQLASFFEQGTKLEDPADPRLSREDLRAWMADAARESGAIRAALGEGGEGGRDRARKSLGALKNLCASCHKAYRDADPAAPEAARGAGPPALPPARRESLVETLHGVPVPDPYRWLEQGAASDVRAWVGEADSRARMALSSAPMRAEFRRRLEELNSLGRLQSPKPVGDRVFFLRRSGNENHAALCVAERGKGPDSARVVLDPNAWSPDGSVALDWWRLSPDAKLLSYGVSRGGTEESTLKLLDVERGRALPDEIPGARQANPAWLHDDSGFYYGRATPAGRRVFFHALGSAPASDPCVLGEDLGKEDWPEAVVSPDDRWLLATVYRGWASEMRLWDRRAPEKGWRAVAKSVDAIYTPKFVGDRVLVQTNEGAQRFRVLAFSPEEPARDGWTELVPESDGILQKVVEMGDRLLLQDLVGAYARIRIASLEGKPLDEVPLPGPGSAGGLHADGDVAVFDFQTFLSPPAIHLYDARAGSVVVWARPARAPDASAFETEALRLPTPGGADRTMFVLRRRGLARDGTHPAILTGAGGFAANVTPGFSPGILAWVEAGGIYAAANLRGGGEGGEETHKAGMLGRKGAAVDDLASAAERLASEGWTRPERLAFWGSGDSALVGAAAVARKPGLFRAAVLANPLADMVRYPRFLLAKLWIPEYGDPERGEDFGWLRDLSPYHALRDGTPYPAVLVLSDAGSTRVDPCHARKLAARWGAASASGLPVFLRTEAGAGHAAKPLGTALQEQADAYGFVAWQLGPAGASAR